MTDYRYKWVATTLMGEPAPEYAERAISRGWRKATRQDAFEEVPLSKDGFDLYCMPTTDFDQQSLAFRKAAEAMELVEDHYMRDNHRAVRKFVGDTSSGDMRKDLEEWYRPENLALYPNRKAELDAANASREKFFRNHLSLPEDVVQKLMAE